MNVDDERRFSEVPLLAKCKVNCYYCRRDSSPAGQHCLCICANPLDGSQDTSHCHPHSKNAAENVSVCLQIAHKYLVEKNLSPADETQFKEQLYRIWFELYTRRGSSRWVESGTARNI